MMKRILIVVCLLAIMGSTFAEDCKSDERCCVRTRFHPGCRRCCKVGDRNDPDSTKPVDCKTDEHCCIKSAAGGCAVCCPNKIDIGHILTIFKGIKDKLPEIMNEMNEMKERNDPDWTKPDIGHTLAIFKGITDKLLEIMNEMNKMKERNDPDWTKPDIGHILAIFKGIKEKLPELMNEMNDEKKN